MNLHYHHYHRTLEPHFLPFVGGRLGNTGVDVDFEEDDPDGPRSAVP
jgi:hypothetical protein